jgi:hypothetical protein
MKRQWSRWSSAVLLLLGTAQSAFAQQEVKIGAIYPLTGAAASSGLEMKNALELAAELINNGAKGLNLPLSGSAGLPNLKGAKIRLVFGDHQSNPQVGATEAERLITQEKVVALIGCYASNVTATASQVAERYHLPFLTAESSSATLTQRKFKWFFRTTPHDELFVQNFFEFLKALEKKKGPGARLQHRREGHLSGEKHSAHFGSSASQGCQAGSPTAIVLPGRCRSIDQELPGAGAAARGDPGQRRRLQRQRISQNLGQGRQLHSVARGLGAGSHLAQSVD